MRTTLTVSDAARLIELEIKMQTELGCALKTPDGLMCGKCRKDFVENAIAYLAIVTEQE